MKKFYKENRVFMILITISIICILIIIGLAIGYIVNSSSNDVYGNRLEGINDVPFESDKINKIEEEVSTLEKVQDVIINKHGKIINFSIDFQNETTTTEAQSIAIKCLDFFEEDYKNFYDIQFLFTKNESEDSEETFPIIGYIKAGESTITWSNNAK